MRVAVTGAAGFIGYHAALHLLRAGAQVTGFDNVNDYYDPRLKSARVAELENFPQFKFIRGDLADEAAIDALFDAPFDSVIHLAAQAGVRYSLENPRSYVSSNISGFLNILEACRRFPPQHLIYASSSSVYGGNRKMPFCVADAVDHPVSLYAATKKSNELMGHVYSHLFGIPATGLRFFTVYGPWGRPDMAYFKFTKAIFSGDTIDIYNNGDMVRDFTYVDDIVDAMTRLIDKPPQPDPDFDGGGPGKSWAPHRVLNIGNNKSERLMDFVSLLEAAVGKPANKRFLPMQPGDVKGTWADVSDLEAVIGPVGHTDLAEGLRRFVDWYRGYYRVDA